MNDRHVALLRGINVGRANRIGMTELRALFEEIGCARVQTLLASGNVVFSATAPGGTGRGPRSEPDIGLPRTQALAARLERAILARFGVTTFVTVMRGSELEEAILHNPLAAVAGDSSRTLVMVLRDDEVAALLRPLTQESWSPEAFAVWKRFAYLWCPSGIAGSRLWNAADRLAGSAGTARNLATVGKLVAAARV